MYKKFICMHFAKPADMVDFEKLVGFPIVRKDFTFNRDRRLQAFTFDREYSISKMFPIIQRDYVEYEKFYIGMPEYLNENIKGIIIKIRFKSLEDRNYFSHLVEQPITDKTETLWFPPIDNITEKNNFTGGPENKYPIYIPSKGRFNYCITMRVLDNMGCDYRVVVEEQEYKKYAKNMGREKLIILPQKYKDNYETCDNIPNANCSGPARNFAWDHSIKRGFTRHWIMDDNIDMFLRYNRNQFYRMYTPAFFRIMEDFSERFVKVAMAGPNYFMFVSRKESQPPFVPNTRLFSCNLIRNDIPFRWRARYNEDADLSIRIMKAGWRTIQFNSFIQRKLRTQSIKGGNTDELYKNGTEEKSEMLKRLHPDCVSLSWKFNRAHHHIHYERLPENSLILKKGISIKNEIDEYGLQYNEYLGEVQ